MKNKNVSWQLLIILVLGVIASIHIYNKYEDRIIENRKDFLQDNMYCDPVINTSSGSELDKTQEMQPEQIEKGSYYYMIEKRS